MYFVVMWLKPPTIRIEKSFFCHCVLIILVLPNSNANTAYRRILNDIFVNYSTDERPVKNLSTVIQVKYEMKLSQLILLDSRYQFVKMLCWISEYWMDDFLYWDPELYDNITIIHLDAGKIWKPDTYPYENLVMDKDEGQRYHPVKVQTIPEKHKVLVQLKYPTLLEFHCQMFTADFPYDTQDCVITIASWTKSAQEIIYRPAAAINTKHMEKNAEWDLIKTLQWENLANYSTFSYPNPEPVYLLWSEAKFEFVFQRQSGFYISSLIVPTAILVQVCLVGVFTLSQSDGIRTEKFTLGVTTILSLTVSLLVVADLIPRGSHPLPRINVFIIDKIIIMSVAMITASLIVYLSRYALLTHSPVPVWLAIITCVKVQEKNINDNSVVLIYSCCKNSITSKNKSNSKSKVSTVQEVLMAVQNVQRHLCSILQAICEDEKDELYRSQWEKVVLRLEIAFLCFFSLASMIDTLVFIYCHSQS